MNISETEFQNWLKVLLEEVDPDVSGEAVVKYDEKYNPIVLDKCSTFKDAETWYDGLVVKLSNGEKFLLTIVKDINK